MCQVEVSPTRAAVPTSPYTRGVTGRLHLMYGLSGSGKSTLARHLAEETPAVRFTLDEWMLRLYHELSIEDEAYGQRAAIVRDLIWSLAEQVLRTGTDVVLDWNSWSQARRRWAVEHARRIGADVFLHHLTTSIEESSRRAEIRMESESVFAHPVDRAGNEHLAGLLEEPSIDEGLIIITH